jgi:uncharacterized delta-60 repeat protein
MHSFLFRFTLFFKKVIIFNVMKIFNYKIINYKRFSAFFVVLGLIISSLSFVFQKPENVFAAPTDGTLDTTLTVGSGFATTTDVESFDVQSDGKYIVGGGFTSYNGTAAGRIVRLNADGTIDSTFTTGTGFSANIRYLKILKQGANAGKILVLGDFTSYNGTTVGRIALLNSDGTLDTAFNTSIGTGLSGPGQFVLEQSDGKLLVTGYFTNFNGGSAGCIVRLNANGTKDTSFVYGSGFNNAPNWIVQNTAGKYIFGGWFTSYNGTPANRIITLNDDGTVDTVYAGSGFDNGIWNITQQSDGKLITTGWFTSYNGTPANRIIRLNSDGTIDGTFNYGTGFNGLTFNPVLQSDGKIIVAGTYTSYNGTAANRIIRLNTDGTIDGTFNYGTGFDSNAKDIQILSDDRVLIGGLFTNYKGVSYPGLARLTVGDTTPPTMTLSALPATVTGDFQVTACPSESLAPGSFTGADVVITNGTIAAAPAFAGPTVTAGCPGGEYTFWVTPTAAGLVDVTVPVGTFTDVALNTNVAASNTVSTTYTIDTTAPVITNISVSAPHGTSPQYLANGTDMVTMTFTSDELLDLGTSVITIAGVPATCVAPAVFPGMYTCTVPTTTIPHGTVIGPSNLSITAVDPAGNTSPVYTATTDGTQVTIDKVAPVATSATVNGSTLTLVYDESVCGTAPAPSTFSVIVAGVPVVPTSVTCSGTNLVLTLPVSVSGGQVVTLNYTGPATADLAANPAANFATFPVNNTTPTPSSSGGGGCLPGSPCSQITGYVSAPIVTTSASLPINQTITEINASCPVFTQYLKKGMRDGKNGISEVSKVQSFLNQNLNINLLKDGIFGSKTYESVKNFQEKYTSKILDPWYLSSPTGWWYQSTRSYANYLENCSEGLVHLDNTIKIRDGIISN